MKILLLITAFNAQAQAVFTALRDRGDEVTVTFTINELQVLEEIEDFNPELILCPVLQTFLPSSIYEAYPTYIFHPGPRGDRGSYALEHALQNDTKEWGLVILRANASYYCGDIYAEVHFPVRDTYKASLYRHEIVFASYKALDLFFKNLKNDIKVPQITNAIHEEVTLGKRKIDWRKDDTKTIIDKIYFSDADPGAPNEILGVQYYLFGVHKEDKLRGKPKEILAKRDGAICLGTIDGAVWVSHLKEIGKFKLPASHVLEEKLQNIKEDPLPLCFDRSYDTFYEISVDIRDDVGYLHFNFHNGAMSTQQCEKLTRAVETLKKQCKVLVLIGGEDFFSNGIDLNLLEDSDKQSEATWENINAINNLVSSVLYAEEIVTIASFQANGAAGGLFMGLACDYMVAKEGVVLNPHYKTLGLSGSTYHTYSLPKRVGREKAQELLDACLPLSAKEAKALGMLDDVYAQESYAEDLHAFAKSAYSDAYILDKKAYLEKNKGHIESLKEKELEVVWSELSEGSSLFHALRKNFVYKISPKVTPARLKVNFKTST